jgi:nitrite reductase (NADH) large subunit
LPRLRRGQGSVREEVVTEKRILIVGGSFAGVSAAQSARETDGNADITILGAEPYLAYNRPRLSYIIGKGTPVESFLQHPGTWYAERRINFIVGRRAVMGSAGSVTDDAGDVYAWDSLVIATGGVSAIPPLPGANLPGVFSLRTYADVKAIEEFLHGKSSVAIIGGGLIGLEAAWTFTQMGKKVYVLDRGSGLLKNQLDDEGMKLAGELVESKGVVPVYEADTQEIQSQDGSLSILLKDGRKVTADMILLSTGVKADISLAKAMALPVNRGIIVDSSMRVRDGIFAAGDAAELSGKTGGIWPVAVEQGKVAGANAAGGTAVYAEVPSSNSTMLMGVTLSSMGDLGRGEGPYMTLTGTAGTGDYKKFYLSGGRIVGAILMGSAARKSLKVKALMEKSGPLSPEMMKASSVEELLDLIQ